MKSQRYISGEKILFNSKHIKIKQTKSLKPHFWVFWVLHLVEKQGTISKVEIPQYVLRIVAHHKKEADEQLFTNIRVWDG